MVQLSAVLKAIGPNATIVFAAWIFMGFLQQRYEGAISRYQQAIQACRDQPEGDRLGSLRNQVYSFRYRCRLMGWATLTGLASAIVLITSLIFAAVDALAPNVAFVEVGGTVAAIGGFVLVITAALIVIAEGRVVSRQIDEEFSDVPELAREPRKRP